MRHAICFLCVVILFSLHARAQSAPATQPAATQAAANEPRPVLILPFQPPSDAKLKDVGRDIQQDLANAMSADLRGRAIAPPDAQPASDAEAALAKGRQLNAGAVIFGQVQTNNDEVRLSGQVLDVQSGKAIGTLKQTGPIASLFRLEDGLMPQVLAALPEGLLNLHGLLANGPAHRPQVIQLPSDASTPSAALSNEPIDGGFNVAVAPYVLPPAPGGTPPASPYAGSYPYRFYAPYSHLFSYDYDPDPFLPLYPGFFPNRFGPRGSAHSPGVEHHESHEGPRESHENPRR
jgi:TolB-like protein